MHLSPLLRILSFRYLTIMIEYPTVSFLPPRNSTARRLAFILFAAVPPLVGLLGLFLGQDANWDLRNYHWYNAYALVTGRLGVDLLPSQLPFFYNPALDVPFYLLASHLPAQLVGFLLSSAQGLNFIFLFMLAHAALRTATHLSKTVLCALLALLGLLGGGGIAQIGTTFYDNVTSLGIFLSVLLVLRFSSMLLHAGFGQAFLLAALCGLPAGLAVGLKLPAVIFAVGLCGGLLFLPGRPERRLWSAFGFGIGVLVGLAITYGPWAWYLNEHFGSPLFPYFNNLFQSPLAPAGSARDTSFLPANLVDYLLFPALFAKDPSSVGEIPWRDLRLPLLYFLLPACLAMRAIFGKKSQAGGPFCNRLPSRYLLAMVSITYFVWLVLFSIYRYIVALEMLAPLLLVVTIGMLPIRVHLRTGLTTMVLAAVVVSISPGNWGRTSAWLDRAVSVELPELTHPEKLMILMAGFEPYSHVISEFPPEIAFVRVQSNFASPDENKGINTVIKERVLGHNGTYKLLMPWYQLPMGEEALRYFDLKVQVQACLPVQDNLYDSKLVICDVQRLNSFTVTP